MAVSRISLINYLGIAAGAIITAAGLDLFLIPNKIAAGGVSGLATVIHYVAHIPVGVTMLALNIPLFLFSVKELGVRFGLNTLFGAVVLSVSIDVIARYAPVITQDIFLSTLYGGVVCGLGMGIVFKYHGTTAGTDLAAKLIHKFTGISVGQALLGVDFFVIALAGIIFNSFELAMYALISLFVTSKVIDLVQEGRSDTKAFFIISNKPAEVAKAIMHDMERGVTFLQGRGGYTETSRDVLFCVVTSAELSTLKKIIHATDAGAFVIVADTTEVLGEGFGRYASSP
ncbi:MAG TPA: YitT family protein [Negativicutes bacterium]|nr:YitT family protein [Negativicutes bacterium]